ncbi:MAG: hypothetical protein AAF633_03740, partial [Chloroflexota bacterium]
DLCTEVDLRQLKPFYGSTLDDGGGCRFEISKGDGIVQVDIDYPNPLDANAVEQSLEALRLWMLNNADRIKIDGQD